MAEKTYKDEFLEIYEKNIKREGSDRLLKWLLSSDFFTCPASTKYHLACEEGLLQHSLHVYYRLKEEVEHTDWAALGSEKPSDETIAITALLHDVCKVNFYKADTKNVKNKDTGKWEQVPYYTIDDQLPYGHGEKSVMIVSSFMHLTREETFAIRWHMGGFDDSVKGGSYALNGAYNMFPLCLLISVADIKATYLDEKEN